jgi:ppGpp synthetase/RelA/SpoT-type nucleotidyltranferase
MISLSKSRVTKAGERLRAHRLGTAPLAEGDYLCERAVVEEFRASHAVALTRVAANLRYYVEGEAVGRTWTVGQRLKAMPTILDKLVRHPRMELARMHDIGGCRGVLSDQAAVDRVITRLQRRWKLREHVWDYVAEPKADGYRAKHLAAIKDGVLIEIQLRTTTQHRWAELVERFDRDHRLELKAGRADDMTRDLFASISELLRLQEQGELSDVDFVRRVTELATPSRARRTGA